MATTIAMVMRQAYPRAQLPHAARCLAGRCAPAVLVLALLVARDRRRGGPAERDDGRGRAASPRRGATVAGTVDPQGHGDDLPLRVRDVVELRPADGRGRRGLGHRRGRRVGRPQRADERHHLPLPPRGDQRGRGRRAARTARCKTDAAPGPPGASTGSARNVTAVAARLAASVDPNGRATTYHFEYGTSTSYGKRTAEASAGSGQSARSVSAAISGLTANTRYHYRVVASNDAGVARGRDRSFVALRNPRASPPPPRPTPRRGAARPRSAGRISGQGVGGATVALERQDFPFGGPFYLVGTKRAAEQRLVLLQGRPAVGDGPPARDHAHDDRRREPDRRGPQRAARRPARRGASPAAACACRARSAPRCPTAAPRCRSARPAARWVPLRRAGVQRAERRALALPLHRAPPRHLPRRRAAARQLRARARHEPRGHACGAELQRAQQAVAGLGALDRRRARRRRRPAGRRGRR